MQYDVERLVLIFNEKIALELKESNILSIISIVPPGS